MDKILRNRHEVGFFSGILVGFCHVPLPTRMPNPHILHEVDVTIQVHTAHTTSEKISTVFSWVPEELLTIANPNTIDIQKTTFYVN